MERMLLPNTTLRLTGVKTVADRESIYGELTYKPHGNSAKGKDVNSLVYDLMVIAAYDQLQLGMTYAGEYTASELAGKAGDYLHMFLENSNEQYEKYDIIKIQTPTFFCSFHPGETFQTITEWEGVAGITKKTAHRFCCEGRELSDGVKLKPYTRCRQPKATNPYSAATEATRINKKFAVIGPMSEALGSEGMKRALAVLTAVKAIGKLHGCEMQDIASQLLRRKLWRDYGKCERLERRKAWLKEEGDLLRQLGQEKSDRYKKLKEEFEAINGRIPALKQPVIYSAGDFQCGPECWKVVDNDYVKELMGYFNKLLAENKKPEWINKNDFVQFKNQANTVKKWQGKLKVWQVFGKLDYNTEKIGWYAEVMTTNGKHDSVIHGIDRFEPWVEPKKNEKMKKCKNEKKPAPKAQTPDVKPQTSAKPAMVQVATYNVKDDAGKDVAFGSYVPNVGYEEPEKPITLSDRLRAALRRQLAMAAAA